MLTQSTLDTLRHLKLYGMLQALDEQAASSAAAVRRRSSCRWAGKSWSMSSSMFRTPESRPGSPHLAQAGGLSPFRDSSGR